MATNSAGSPSSAGLVSALASPSGAGQAAQVGYPDVDGIRCDQGE